MLRILKRPQAVTDLEDIWWYIAQNNLQDADKLLDRIQEKLMNLAEFPQMGMGQDGLKPGLRSFTVGNYLVFYFPLVDGIDVVRVLHVARDLDAIFQSGGSWQD
jgi:toxin ParE1/3/4